MTNPTTQVDASMSPKVYPAIAPVIPHVYVAMTKVMAELGISGIAKSSKNTQQGYSFRGIDSVHNELSPILAKHSLLMLPRVLARDVTERITQKGGVLFYVVVEVEFDFISSEDASKHTIKIFGEAMDSADKATNKAMSAAYKYAAIQAFCIPVVGNDDADATTHDEVAPKQIEPKASKAVMRPVDKEMRTEIEACQTIEELTMLWRSKPFQTEYERLPKDWKEALVEFMAETKASLMKAPPHDGYVAPSFNDGK